MPLDKDSNTDVVLRDRLSALPDELLLHIFEAVGCLSRRDLCNVSRVNKRCHRLSDAVLYKSILFETPELHLTFSESLSRRPRRGSAIHEIKLAYPSSELSQLALDAPVAGSYLDPKRSDSLSRTLSIMSNLEKLDISVPDVLLHGIGTLFNGPFDLACLKSCSLFYQCANDAYWDLRENIHIFAHPTLETLTIRRAKLDEKGFDHIERPHMTALKQLHLIECDINDDSLGDLLELPEALEEFVMTQTEEPEPELEESSDNVGDYILAAQSQAEFLKSITIDHPTLTGRKVLRMREFAALKTLRLNWDYQLFGKSSKKPRLHSVGLPPVMDTLEFFNELGSDAEVTDLLLATIEQKAIVARNWKTLVVVEGEDGVSREIKDACKTAGLQLDIIGAMDEDTESENESGNEPENGSDSGSQGKFWARPDARTQISESESESESEDEAGFRVNRDIESDNDESISGPRRFM
ncbi:hypothetical protein J4E80_002145 [Alternaria sp. BMP 0032]|nr:hypothetical protein J4E80_002145 [Alternaria sp. BMP 0032]